MISLCAVSYKYPSGRAVLSEVDLVLQPGEIVALVGPSGSGKTTLGEIIAGLRRPSGGEVKLDNVSLRKYKAVDLRRRVGVVFQDPTNQIVFTNTRDDLLFALKNLGVPETEWETRLTEGLQAVGMVEFTHANPYELSFGQKQRIVIAEALALRPDYLVLDEPTAMLDQKNRELIYRVLRAQKKAGVGILLITNNSEEIKYADRVMRLEDGRLIDDLRRQNVKQRGGSAR